VEALEAGLLADKLTNSEVFVFTNNSTAEGAFYKGHSDSKLLFDLILQLRQIKMSGALHLHVVHVTGTRMIQQGTDGLSHGDMTEGVMQRSPMLDHIPLHLDATQRSHDLLAWIRSWCPDPNITPILPANWFKRGHGLHGGVWSHYGLWHATELTNSWYLWCPAPSAAPAAVEELQVSRLKRTNLNHIFLCPRLMTQYWRKRLHRLADTLIEISAGALPFWPLQMHRPLILGLTLCFVSVYPWQLKYSNQLLELEGSMRSFWRSPLQEKWPLLRQLCELPRELDAVYSSLVWYLLYNPPSG